MPRVLIITYYWPPSGGSAVLRWLAFAKYLPEFGFTPVVYTPSNPEPLETDYSLLDQVHPALEVIHRPIWEPYGIYKKLTGRKKEDRLGVALMSGSRQTTLLSRISLWIRSNLFVPDPRIYWVKPSIRFLSKYLAEQPASVVVTTGPPHSIHLIGKGLKKTTGIKWVADFRDPWTNIDFYGDLMLTRLAHQKQCMLENSVLTGADRIISVSPTLTEELKSLGAASCTTITNGYDQAAGISEDNSSGKFILLHLGSLPRSRNPESLWKAFAGIIRKNPAFAEKLEICLTGKVDASVKASIEYHGLTAYSSFTDYVPHANTLHLYQRSHVLLLLINQSPNSKGILTNKFFEYLASRKPILAIGPPGGDADLILKEMKAGKLSDYSDVQSVSDYLEELFHLYSQGNLPLNSLDPSKYSRKNLTAQLSQLLNELTS